MIPTPPPGSEPWMPNGFPPPSFVVDTETIGMFAGARGRWLAGAAILGALLLIIGVLLIARQGPSDKTALTTGTSTTIPDPFPTSESTSTSLDPTATLPEATTGPLNPITPSLPGATTVTTVAPTTAPPTTKAPGVLAVTPAALTLPNTAPQAGKVTLKNTGGSPLSFTTDSEFKAAGSFNPGSGTIAPGASADVTFTLGKFPEGRYTKMLQFGGTGGTKLVTVTVTTGEPPIISDTFGEPCLVANPKCSKLIKLDPARPTDTSPCESRWHYAAGISDASVFSARANASKKVGAVTTPALVDLRTGGVTPGRTGEWRSDVFVPLEPGTTLTFTIEASDEFGYASKTAEQTITC